MRPPAGVQRPDISLAGRQPPRESLAAQVTRALSALISSGHYKSGDRLPSEAELGERYGVSRTVVREAISSLRADGTVASYQGKGAYVLDAPGGGSFRIDARELGAAQEVVKVLELRIGLETEAAALAASQRSTRALQSMRQAHRAMARAIEAGQDAIAEDLAFHRAMMAATGNRYFVDFFNYLGTVIIPRARVNRFGADVEARKQYLRTVNGEHENLLAAIEDADPHAARLAVQQHLGRSRDALKASLANKKKTPRRSPR